MRTTKIDIGNLCTHCGRDTRFGSVDAQGNELLLYVNRIPSETDTKSGYMCAECRQMPCDKCGNMVLDDYEILEDAQGSVVCSDCIEIV